MDDVLASGKCTNKRRGDAVVNYMQQTAKSAKVVIPKIRSFIAAVSVFALKGADL